MPRRQDFDHIGVITDEQQPGESYVPETKVFVTNPRAHACNVEFLRFEGDSPLSGPVREQPHVAYRVLDLDAAIAGKQLLLEPFEVGGGFLRVAFTHEDGAVVEYMQYRDPDEEGWF
jgi:hypothetical protein